MGVWRAGWMTGLMLAVVVVGGAGYARAQKPPAMEPHGSPPTKPPAPVIVSKVEVKFHTNDDDKDPDTKLTTDFMCHDSVFASSNIKPPVTIRGGWDSYSDSFSDNQDTPWIEVGIANTVAKAGIHACQTKIRIDPKGHDTWKFNYWVRLWYSDGSHDEYHYDGHALSQNTRENIFPLN